MFNVIRVLFLLIKYYNPFLASCLPYTDGRLIIVYYHIFLTLQLF